MDFRSLGFCIVIALFGAVFLYMAYLPGRIARRRGHVNADAICLLGRLGIFTVVLWFAALIWAHTGKDANA